MEHDKRNSNNHVPKSIFSQAVYDMRFIPFPYLYLNRTGVILFANKHITQLNGYSLLEIVQHSIDEVVEHHLADRLIVLASWTESQPHGVAINIKHKAGHNIPTRIKVMVDTTENATVQGFHLFVIPAVEEQHEADALPNPIADDYLELQKSLQAQTVFIQNYLHELKTPISTLSTSLYLLSHAPEASRQRYIDLLHQHIEYLKDMIHDAAEYLHIGLFDNTVNGQILPLNRLVDELAEVYQYRFEAKNIRFQLKLPSRDCHVMGDRHRLLRVFINVLENAYRYTDMGQVTLALQADYDKSLVFVIIQDTGIGIPAAEIPHIFERFYRAENAKGREQKGTGLGLCITKQIVEQHNGEIEVYSRQNAGTSIVITLPLVI
jgi:signal transduction histidine kinase